MFGGILKTFQRPSHPYFLSSHKLGDFVNNPKGGLRVSGRIVLEERRAIIIGLINVSRYLVNKI